MVTLASCFIVYPEVTIVIRMKLIVPLFILALLTSHTATAGVTIIFYRSPWYGQNAYQPIRHYQNPRYYSGHRYKNKARYYGIRDFPQYYPARKAAPYRDRHGYSSGYNRYHQYYRNNNHHKPQYRNSRPPNYNSRR